MTELRCTLLTDGPADRALIPILRWLLLQRVSLAINIEWADLRRLARPPTILAKRVQLAVELYPCELLFVHRDAEGEEWAQRTEEIEAALAAGNGWDRENTVPVVPVRMTEAWLLLDEAALRRAAGNSMGSTDLHMPSVRDIEALPDPKGILHGLLRDASGLVGRRLRKFRMEKAVHNLAGEIEDYSTLRQLSAFRSLEEEIGDIVGRHGWIVDEAR